jgi:TPR repeat protein
VKPNDQTLKSMLAEAKEWLNQFTMKPRFWCLLVISLILSPWVDAQEAELQRHAEQGEAIAQLSLGLMYLEGRGFPQDNRVALLWFKRSAEQGLSNAQFFCGQMYMMGKGVEVDYAAAFRWYELAANQGLGSAHHALGLMYEHGLGVPENFVESYARYFYAVATGFKPAEKDRENIGKLMTKAEVAKAMIRSKAIWEEFEMTKLIQRN